MSILIYELATAQPSSAINASRTEYSDVVGHLVVGSSDASSEESHYAGFVVSSICSPRICTCVSKRRSTFASILTCAASILISMLKRGEGIGAVEEVSILGI